MDKKKKIMIVVAAVIYTLSLFAAFSFGFNLGEKQEAGKQAQVSEKQWKNATKKDSDNYDILKKPMP